MTEVDFFISAVSVSLVPQLAHGLALFSRLVEELHFLFCHIDVSCWFGYPDKCADYLKCTLRKFSSDTVGCTGDWKAGKMGFAYRLSANGIIFTEIPSMLQRLT